MTVRRTSLTTLLAHGAAVVTTTGAYTEPIWTRDGDVVAAAPAGNRTAIGAELGRLIGNRDRRRALAARAEEFYSRHFGPTHAVDALAHKGMAPLPVVVGAHASGRPGVGARHDAFARGLRSFPGARLFDIQFAQDATPPPVVHGAERVRTLWQDSIAVSGRGGARKPIVREIFDALALRAVEMNSRYFMYVNADVEVDARALTLIARGMQDVYLFARTDVGAGRPPEVLRSGVDAFAVDVRWWMQNRWRFRPYVLGEPTWDNVYAAIAMCHAPAAVVCDAGLLRHERHERAWSNSPFAEYQQWLAALDAPYFSLWCEYFEQTKAVDESALPQAARQAAERVFRFRPTRQALAIQALRSAKASVRYVLRDGALES
jgi:hypothetical protein